MLCMFLSLCMMLITVPMAFGTELNEPEITGLVVNITGALPTKEEGKSVTLVLLKKGKTLEDLKNGSPLNFRDIVNHVYESKTGKDGVYTFTFMMHPDDPSGTYLLRVNGTGFSKIQEKQIHYISYTLLLDAINAFNNAGDESQIGQAITDYAAEIGLDLNDYLNSLDNEHQQLVRTNLLGISLNTEDITKAVETLRTEFNKAVGLQRVNIESVEGLDAVLNKYKIELGLDVEDYNNLNTSSKNKICGILEKINFSRPQDLVAEFNKAKVVELINNLERWGDVEALIEKYAADPLGISIGDNSDFSKVDSASVYKSLLKGIPYDTIEQINNAFDNAVKDLLNKKNSQNDTGGSSKTGKSSRGTRVVVSAPVTTAPMPTSTPDTIPQPQTEKFTDLDGVPWAIESIQSLAAEGIISGKGNGFFDPDGKVTREEFLKMLIEAFKLVDEEASVEFTDVSKDEWYYPYVASAKKYGIINGLGDESFGVNSKITRQDMALMAYRVATHANIQLPVVVPAMNFADEEEIAQYAIDSVKVMQQAGIIGGVGDGRFAPTDYATRAQAAKIVYELLKYSK